MGLPSALLPLHQLLETAGRDPRMSGVARALAIVPFVPAPKTMKEPAWKSRKDPIRSNRRILDATGV